MPDPDPVVIASPFAPPPLNTSRPPVDPQMELRLAIEVSSNGERTPETFLDDIQVTQYAEGSDGSKQLTAKGAATAYSIGAQLRTWAMDSDTNWIDVDSYSAADVYVLASALERSQDSATAQLQGLFGIPFSLPLPDLTATGYETSIPTAL